ncbi:sulfatase [Candidatus Eisenbacteria bacterium]|uniref:Sulfatase n=1 Tax=Eiseniibacteriota bacterium TaxID=2212470 RepID=A0ABV6YJG6_UNCEI
MLKVRSALLILVAFSLAISGLSCNGNNGTPPNILLISVDTLRPDRLGYAGHDRNTSPNIDVLAREGVVFPNAYSVSGWTLPSMATILTGLYPKDHGARDLHWGLNETVPTLASILQEHGFESRGYVSHIVLTPEYGFGKGFTELDHSVLEDGDPHEMATSEELTNLALQGLGVIKEPFFVWVHYFDPHFDYLRHDRWSSFGTSDIDRYDQEIAFTDHHIGRLLEFLRQKGLYDNTIIIFTSDHGEEFGDHGGKYHYTCYDEVLRVPLIIKAPALPPGQNEEIAEQIDFVPSILARLQIESPPNLPGRNLFIDEPDPRPTFIARDRPPGYQQLAVIDDGYKFLRIVVADTTAIPEKSRGTYVDVTNVVPGTYLYNLAADPREKRNLFDGWGGETQKLMTMLTAHFTGNALPAERIQLDEETKEKLRSLGYIQ